MRNHFNENLHLVLGEDIAALQRMAGGNSTFPNESRSPWSMFSQVIVSLDSVKPMGRRKGWKAEKIAQYNHSRFEELVTAGWDLVIVDESHRIGGSSEQVARYKLGKGLAEASPYLLLLSATPHQGKSDAFYRLVRLLDDLAFPNEESVTRERVAPWVIRTEKRKAVDGNGKPLFKPRRAQMLPVVWEDRHQRQKLLYEAVSEYVRDGYNQALRENKRQIGFLMLLMQRLVVSSTSAIRATLERRLSAIMEYEQKNQILDESRTNEESLEADYLDELMDSDSQNMLDTLLAGNLPSLKHERKHVEYLLQSAIDCELNGPDAKAEALLELLYKLRTEEDDPDLKLLIFTEFVPTQRMLKNFLEARGFGTVVLNGTMSMKERIQAQEDFRQSCQILISTDAGGEGLNLQFAHVAINYDIPWNPMRIEQRIGRVDRIGQDKVVRAINFIFEDSVEFGVLEVLERKLAIIFQEFGIDKTGDILDSGQAAQIFDDAFISAILHPDKLENSVEDAVEKVRAEINQLRETSPIYGLSDDPSPQIAEYLRSHPLPLWLERMTLAWLKSHGGSARRTRFGWDLRWPDGYEQHKAAYTQKNLFGDADYISMEDNRIRGLIHHLPRVVPGQPLPCIAPQGLPAKISGLWGLFEIRLQSSGQTESKFMRIPKTRNGHLAVFITGDRKIFLPTARHIWDLLLTNDVETIGYLTSGESLAAHEQLLAAAVESGQALFLDLRNAHLAAVAREEERGAVFFAARHKAIDRLGLPDVRKHRLNQCEAEERGWRDELEACRNISPEIRPLLMLRVLDGFAI